MSTLTPTLPKIGPMFTFDPNAHQYFLDGVEIPGVTTILKTAGLCRDYSGFTDATLRGLHVHTACEWLDLDDLDWNSVYPQWLGYVKSYARFKDDTGFVPQLIEAQRYHPAFRFGGTLDRIGLYSQQRVQLDLKTGLEENWHPFQTAGYDFLEKSDRRGALYLKEDGTYRLVWHDDPADLRVFLAANTITQTKWRLR